METSCWINYINFLESCYGKVLNYIWNVWIDEKTTLLHSPCAFLFKATPIHKTKSLFATGKCILKIEVLRESSGELSPAKCIRLWLANSYIPQPAHLHTEKKLYHCEKLLQDGWVSNVKKKKQVVATAIFGTGNNIKNNYFVRRLLLTSVSIVHYECNMFHFIYEIILTE